MITNREETTQNLTTLTLGPGPQTQVRLRSSPADTLATQGANAPPPAPRVAWKASSSLWGRIVRCLRRSQQSGWECARSGFLNVGNLFHVVFKLRYPHPAPPCGPNETHFSGQLPLLHCWFWPLALIIPFFPPIIPDYLKYLHLKVWVVLCFQLISGALSKLLCGPHGDAGSGWATM